MDNNKPETLVAAFNFPPYNDGSAATMAKRIVERGEPVDVIAADLSRIRSTDPSMSDLVRPYVRNLDYLKVPVQFSSEGSVVAFMKAGNKTIGARGRSRYREVFSRSMWAHSHFLAAQIYASRMAHRWTAEFSDPLLWNADASRRVSGEIDDLGPFAEILSLMGRRYQVLLENNRSVLYWAQMLPCILADEIMFTNIQQYNLMQSDAPMELRARVRERAIISPHPSLASRFYASQKTGTISDDVPIAGGQSPFRIGYFGTFYPNRGAGEFIEALAIASRTSARNFRLEVFSNGGGRLQEVAEILGVGHLVSIRQPLRYASFLEETSQFDALLVNDISTTPFGMPSPFLPSKVSDYRGSSSPVMAVTIPGSPLDLLEVKYKAHVGDVDGIARMLLGAASAI